MLHAGKRGLVSGVWEVGMLDASKRGLVSDVTCWHATCKQERPGKWCDVLAFTAHPPSVLPSSPGCRLERMAGQEEDGR